MPTFRLWMRKIWAIYWYQSLKKVEVSWMVKKVIWSSTFNCTLLWPSRDVLFQCSNWTHISRTSWSKDNQNKHRFFLSKWRNLLTSLVWYWDQVMHFIIPYDEQVLHHNWGHSSGPSIQHYSWPRELTSSCGYEFDVTEPIFHHD